MIRLHLKPQFEQALNAMAAQKGMSADALATETIREALEDWEDARDAEAAFAAHLANPASTWTMEQIARGDDLKS